MKAEFDEKAATWDDDPVRVKRADVIAKVLKSRVDLSKVNKALEYGSGTGLLTFALKENLNEVILMDESAEMTKVANQKSAQLATTWITARQYDLLKEPLPKDRFELIYILLTMHHIIDYEALLRKFSQLLHPNGHLAIIDLEKEDGSFHDGEFYGHKGFDKCILRQNLEEVGLIPQSYEVCYELEKTSEDGSKRSYPLFLFISKKQAN